MSKENNTQPIYKPNDPRWEVEHILCERKTAVPWENAGPTQYLIKYVNFDFDRCWWCHGRSIHPKLEGMPLDNWNKLTKKEKNIRYKYLNDPCDFMSLSPKKKIDIGWQYAIKFDLDIFTQTPLFTQSPDVDSNAQLNDEL